MTQIWFYHLQTKPLEVSLPRLLEKALERNVTIVVQSPSQERIEQLDQLLWTYSEDSFLPHGREGDPHLDADPVALVTGQDNPNRASMRLLLDQAPFPDPLSDYDRVMVMFDGNDDATLAHARGQWKQAMTFGVDLSYLQQSETGMWEKKHEHKQSG
jgi:DNA polymerase-3 subunit chi